MGASVVLRCGVVLMLLCAVVPGYSQEDRQTDTLWSNGNHARLHVERVLFHPGMFGTIQGIQVDAYYSRPFGMRELETRSVLLMIPVGKQRFGLSVTSFGDRIYSENGITFMHLLPIVPSLFVTSELSWIPVSISGYDRLSDVSLTEGLFLQWTRFTAGVRYIGVVSGGNAHTRAGSVQGMHLRAGFTALSGFKVTFAFIQEDGFRSLWVVENRIMLGGTVGLVIEVGANPSSYSLGVEIRRRRVQFAYHLKQHPDLGSTVQAGMSYRFRKKR